MVQHVVSICVVSGTVERLGRSEAKMTGRIVVAANRLPVRRVGGRWEMSPGGLVSALTPLLQQGNGVWVGWTGEVDEKLEPFSHDSIDMYTVPLSTTEVDCYYLGLCNGTIWPLYHDGVRTPIYSRSWWKIYKQVNTKFAVTLADITTPDDVLWVHDYHLQLVPGAIRSLVPTADIRFFLHIPFPPLELFARLPWRREVVTGLLGADVVGFQTRRNADNFINAAQTFADAAVDDGQLVSGDSTTKVVTAPISIDGAEFVQIASSPATMDKAKRLRRDLGDPEIIMLGADRMDYTKGIDVRLRAFESLLKMQPDLAEKTKFVQVAVPSRETIGDYAAMRETVERIAGRINGAFGARHSMPVHYIYESLSREDLTAYYRAADVMVVSPLADGMNLVAKEYVASRVDDEGVLLLSEFAGAAQELDQAVSINPYDIDGMARAMLQAVSMSRQERQERMKAMRQVVLAHDIHNWINQALTQPDRADEQAASAS